MRLFCFTFAGGTSRFFDPLAQCLEPSIKVTKLEYAGHGSRHGEPFYRTFEELAEDLYGIIRQTVQAGDHYALLGYSMGSVAAVQVLQNILLSNELEPPCHVFLSAHAPMIKKEYAEYGEESTVERLKEHLIHNGGIPEKLISNQIFWRTYMPIYRTDYALLGKYDFRQLQLSSGIPATVFYSRSDTSLSDMECWKRHFIDQCEFVEYEGGHFFIHKHIHEMADVIKVRLREYGT